MNVIDPMIIITTLASVVATLAGVLWRTQVKETEFWKALYLSKADKDKSALDLIADYIQELRDDQPRSEGGRRGR